MKTATLVTVAATLTVAAGAKDVTDLVTEVKESYNAIESLDVDLDVLRGFDLSAIDLDNIDLGNIPGLDSDLSTYKAAAEEALARCQELDFSAAKPAIDLVSRFIKDTECMEQVEALVRTTFTGTGNDAMSAACGIPNRCILTYGVAAQHLGSIAIDAFEPAHAEQLKKLTEADLDKLAEAKSLVCTFIPGGGNAEEEDLQGGAADTIEELMQLQPGGMLPEVEGFPEAVEWLKSNDPGGVLELIALCPALKDSDRVRDLLDGFDFDAFKADFADGAGAAAAKLAEAIEKARAVGAVLLPEEIKEMLDAKLNEAISALDASEVAKLFEKCKEEDVELSSSRIELTEAQTSELTSEQVAAFEAPLEVEEGGGNGAAARSLAASAAIAAALLVVQLA